MSILNGRSNQTRRISRWNRVPIGYIDLPPMRSVRGGERMYEILNPRPTEPDAAVVDHPDSVTHFICPASAETHAYTASRPAVPSPSGMGFSDADD
jgi:hypothetical protein